MDTEEMCICTGRPIKTEADVVPMNKSEKHVLKTIWISLEEMRKEQQDLLFMKPDPIEANMLINNIYDLGIIETKLQRVINRCN